MTTLVNSKTGLVLDSNALASFCGLCAAMLVTLVTLGIWRNQIKAYMTRAVQPGRAQVTAQAAMPTGSGNRLAQR